MMMFRDLIVDHRAEEHDAVLEQAARRLSQPRLAPVGSAR